jgi:multicomponent Na+:H+ antiporter subunit A
MIVVTGTTQISVILDHPAWQENPAFASTTAVLLIIAAFTKSAQFPFHYWLPDAMAASTPVSAYLHAAAMVKAGIYLLMRFSHALASNPVWNVTLIAVGLTTAVIGALFALQRHDLKELLAYGTVSQLGFIVAVIGIGTPGALAAAGLHTLAHALFKATLFMLVGVIDREVGSRDIRKLTGLRKAMPITAALAALSALSMAGVPPLLGFVSKEKLFDAFIDAPGPEWAGAAVGVVAVLGAILTFAYSFRIVYGAFGGPLMQKKLHEPSLVFLLPAAVSSLAGLALGLSVWTLNPLIDRVVLDARGTPGEVELALWHGFSVPVLMSAVTITLGVVLFLKRVAVDRLLDRKLFPITGVEAFENTYYASIGLGRRVGDLTRTNAPTRHLAMPVVLLAALGVAVVSVGVPVADFPAPVAQPVDWLLLVVLIAGVLGLVAARSRLAGLALLGAIGFAIALLFFALGAPDVGLTQLLVEVLTVVVAVLILRRLPALFHATSRGRKATAAVFAVVAGTLAGAATFLFTGRREVSPAADYFLREAEEQTGGVNVVNTILVDFRALDTLGELTVLGVAGLVIIAVLRSGGLIRGDRAPEVGKFADTQIGSPLGNTVLARTVGRWIAPLIILLSVYLLLRGHDEPGGGFIAALIGGAGVALAYLSAPSAEAAPIRWPYRGLIAAGIGTAVLVGVLGFADGSFLRPLHADIPLPGGSYYHFTTALLFDVGVYLAVIGVVIAALNQLGAEDTGGEDGVTAEVGEGLPPPEELPPEELTELEATTTSGRRP